MGDRPQPGAELLEQALAKRDRGRHDDRASRTGQWQHGKERTHGEQCQACVHRRGTADTDQETGDERSDERAKALDRSGRGICDGQRLGHIGHLGEERRMSRPDQRDGGGGQHRHEVRDRCGGERHGRGGTRQAERQDGVGAGQDLGARASIAEHRRRRRHEDRRQEHHARCDPRFDRSTARVGVHHETDPGAPLGDAEDEERRDQPPERRQPEDCTERCEGVGHARQSDGLDQRARDLPRRARQGAAAAILVGLDSIRARTARTATRCR